MSPDVVNALFELFGGVFVWGNVRRLWIDRCLRGVDWRSVAFFWSWGMWNLFFYSHLAQWWSWAAGMFIAAANMAWLGLLGLVLAQGQDGSDQGDIGVGIGLDLKAAAEERITDPKTGGQKGRKPERYDLIPFWALDVLARVYAMGAKKYAPHNYLRGYDWSLSLGALLRHVAEFAKGNDFDPESGEHHLAHVAWHCFTLIMFRMFDLGTDDRWKDQPSAFAVADAESARRVAAARADGTLPARAAVPSLHAEVLPDCPPRTEIDGSYDRPDGTRFDPAD